MKTLIFFVDAVRSDYITEHNTPFLHKLKNENYYSELGTMLGYSAGIHPSIWTSKFQEDHGKFLVYSFEEDKSPFKWMKGLTYVPSIIRRVGISALKFPFYASKHKNLFPEWYKQKILPVPASVDPKQAGHFNYNQSLDYDPTFFTILKENEISMFSCATGTHPLYGEGIKIEDWAVTDNVVDHFFVYETDPVGHYNGPTSIEIHDIMARLDTKIAAMYAEAKEKFGDVNLFIFSDHGMVEVKGSVNVKEVVDKLPLKPVKDYLVFYDSTMVRFKVKDNAVKQQIIDAVSQIENVNHLDETLQEKYKIRFDDDKWGNLMFLVDPGFRVFPDYFAPVKFNTKGMHGYWPDHKDSLGVLLCNRDLKGDNPSVIDLMPTMLEAIGLKDKIPKDIAGKSLF